MVPNFSQIIGPALVPGEASSSRDGGRKPSDVPRRWKVPIAETNAKGQSKLPDAALTILAEVALAVTKKLPLGSPTLTLIFQKEINKMGLETKINERWVRDFLGGLGYTYGANQCPGQKTFTAEGVAESQFRLKLKVAFLGAVYDIPPHRVWNADETAVRLLPLNDRGWGPKGRPKRFLADKKRVITLTLACCMAGGPMLAQAIYQGKTKASLPKVPVPKGMSCTQTENHWRSLETCELFLKQIDEQMNPNGEKVPWLLVYDVDPVHVSKAFKVMRLEFPWIKFAYVDPGKTKTSQPLDRHPHEALRPSISPIRCFGVTMRIARLNASLVVQE